mmetsp:Transcript_5354/g.14487  ORF Transcript_5354/g.14487 Transcript_5354/m.14487 type:complete len:140 (+) Transcript_5354:1405-1824(+)
MINRKLGINWFCMTLREDECVELARAPACSTIFALGHLPARIIAHRNDAFHSTYLRILSEHILPSRHRSCQLDLDILLRLLRKNFVKPNIVRHITLAEVPNAHKFLSQHNCDGEIVCLPWKKEFGVLRPNNATDRKAAI